MKILVTGASGYLGVGIVESLSRKGIQVVAACRNEYKFNNNVDCVKCDIFSIDDPYTYFGKPNCVLHLAWSDGFKHFSKTHIENLPKHFEFLSKIANSAVESICCMGSVHEIGFYEGCVDEKTPCNPLSYYGISKNALRQVASILCRENRKIFKWIRGYYIVGKQINGCSIFSKIAQAEIKGEKYFPFTSGQNQFDFIDYENFCEGVVKIVLQNDINGIINCCSGKPMRLADCVEKFIKDNNFNIKLEYGKFPDRPYDSKAIWGNSKLFEKIINNQYEYI